MEPNHVLSPAVPLTFPLPRDMGVPDKAMWLGVHVFMQKRGYPPSVVELYEFVDIHERTMERGVRALVRVGMLHQLKHV